MLAACLAGRTCRRKLKTPIFSLTPSSLFHSLEAASSPLLDISQFHVKGFSETYDPFVGRAVHGLMVKTLFVHDIIHFNTLVNMYVRFGDLDAARCVFDEMPEKNQASWSTMVSGYVKWCLFYEAGGLFRVMQGAARAAHRPEADRGVGVWRPQQPGGVGEAARQVEDQGRVRQGALEGRWRGGGAAAALGEVACRHLEVACASLDDRPWEKLDFSH